MDFSAIEAIDSVAQKYIKMGKAFSVKNPGPNCRALLDSAENITSIKIDSCEHSRDK